jgi:hypothetical protein
MEVHAMSEHFTEADVDLGVAALWAKQYPYSADLVDCVLTAVAPAMRDRWLEEVAELIERGPDVPLRPSIIAELVREQRSGGDQ